MENKPIKTVKFIFDNPTLPEWMSILLTEVSKIADVKVAYTNSIREKSLPHFLMTLFLAFEEKLSSTLRTSNYKQKKLTHELVENNTHCDVIINLSSIEVPNSTRIYINGVPLKNGELAQHIWHAQGSKILVEAVRDKMTMLEYQNSHQSFFITSRLNNIVASISDVVYYHILNENNPRKNDSISEKSGYWFSLWSYCLVYFFRLVLIKIEAKLQRTAWHIAIKNENQTVVVKNPPHTFKADPFLFKHNNEVWLCFEELNYTESNKGYISVSKINDIRDVSMSTKVITGETHFSYPYIISHNNSLFCVPETKEKREIALYRIDDILHEWKKSTVLIKNIEAVDTSLIYHQDKWWLFCTAKTTKLSNSGDALLIFSADSLETSTWVPHPHNPVKLSNASARQAGNFYINQQQELIRPVQDGSYTYGGSINLMRVDLLSDNDYVETLIQSIKPQEFHPKAKAIHTINTIDQYTVVDLILNRKHVN